MNAMIVARRALVYHYDDEAARTLLLINCPCRLTTQSFRRLNTSANA